jgi:hypothetical protein
MKLEKLEIRGGVSRDCSLSWSNGDWRAGVPGYGYAPFTDLLYPIESKISRADFGNLPAQAWRNYRHRNRAE